MYIQPTGMIKILHGVELNKTYLHTIIFPSVGSKTPAEVQRDYFFSLAKYTFDSQSYVRYDRGYIRIEKKVEELYDCNYMMFQNYQNTQFVGKWFYAFIDEVTYINNEVSQVHFTIDVMQTWLYDYELRESFIERTHVVDDSLFANLVPEEINMGNSYVSIDAPEAIVVHPTGVVILSTNMIPIDSNGETHGGIRYHYGTWQSSERQFAEVDGTDYLVDLQHPNMFDFMFSGLYWNIYNFEDYNNRGADVISGIIDVYNNHGKEDEIIAIYMAYSPMPNKQSYTLRDYTVPMRNYLTSDGWRPNNNKLFSYPYNKLSISNNNGSTIDLLWEQWDNSHRGALRMVCENLCSTAALLSPLYYEGIEYDWDSGIKLENYPVCAWSGDAFKGWWAQNSSRIGSYAMQSLAHLGGVAMGFDTPSFMIPYLTGGISNEKGLSVPNIFDSTMGLLREDVRNDRRRQFGADKFNQYHDALAGMMPVAGRILGSINAAKHMPNRHHGDISGSYLNTASGRMNFQCYRMALRKEILVRIDKYFDMFGYAVKQVGLPLRSARNYYTYIKTVDCNIRAQCPEDDAEAIIKIFDNGITFWRYVDGRPLNVGDYSVASQNTPIVHPT